MAKKTTPITDEAYQAFLDAVKDIMPLNNHKIPHTIQPAPTRYPSKTSDREMDDINFHEYEAVAPLDGETNVFFHRDGISHKILRNLRKGQYNVDAILDLHGMTVEVARTKLKEFLAECLHHEARVVLIIPGKGQRSHSPILKNKLNQWLRTIDIVLAFCTATTKHGSRGAMYVYLKHIKEENSLG